MNFLKDKFEVIIVTVMLGVMFGLWVQSDFRPDIKEFLIAVFGAWLALLKVSTRPTAIGSASTESGDIITQPPPTDSAKDLKK